MTDKYTYDQRVWAEVERMARDALPRGSVLQKATLEEDFGGIDAIYRVNHRCDLQIRCRFDRPAYAPDVDVTFRTTEPAMIAAETYAPLMLFCWFRGGFAVAGKLIDVYLMAENIKPPLGPGRYNHSNGDGTYWQAVTIGELHEANALLRIGDRDGWATARLGGMNRAEHLLRVGS